MIIKTWNLLCIQCEVYIPLPSVTVVSEGSEANGWLARHHGHTIRFGLRTFDLETKYESEANT